MCRSIKKLANPEQIAPDEEIYAASLQYIRKVSGSRKPSKLNEVEFEKGVKEVALATKHLLEKLKYAQSKKNISKIPAIQN